MLAQCWASVVSSGSPYTPAKGVEPMLVLGWPTACDIGPTLREHWIKVSRLIMLMGREINCRLRNTTGMSKRYCSIRLIELLVDVVSYPKV